MIQRGLVSTLDVGTNGVSMAETDNNLIRENELRSL